MVLVMIAATSATLIFLAHYLTMCVLNSEMFISIFTSGYQVSCQLSRNAHIALFHHHVFTPVLSVQDAILFETISSSGFYRRALSAHHLPGSDEFSSEI